MMDLHPLTLSSMMERLDRALEAVRQNDSKSAMRILQDMGEHLRQMRQKHSER